MSKTKTRKTSKPAPIAEQPLTRDGLPYQAFAIVPNPYQSETWKLPHHTRLIYRAVNGNKVGYEHTVNWENMYFAVALLSRRGIEGCRVQAEPHEILEAAKHLASHYRKAGKPLPDALAVLA